MATRDEILENALKRIRAWDMVHEPAPGVAEPCHDAPQIRELIDRALKGKGASQGVQSFMAEHEGKIYHAGPIAKPEPSCEFVRVPRPDAAVGVGAKSIQLSYFDGSRDRVLAMLAAAPDEQKG